MSNNKTQVQKPDFSLQDKKLLEEKLLLSKAKLAEIEKIAHIGSWENNLIKNSIWWSDELYRIFGFDPKTTILSYDKFINSVHPDDRDVLEKLIKKRESYRSDYRIVMPDGEIKYIHEEVLLVKDDGKTIMMKGTAQDVTKRVQTETVLRESEEKYKALYDNAPLAYQSLDENGHFIDINPTWLNILGYEREEVVGAYFADFLHPKWKIRFDKNFAAFKKRGYIHDVQFKIRHKDGHYLDISFEGCIGVNPDGSFKQTYCVFQDITARVSVQEALQKSERDLRKAQKIAGIGSWKWNTESNQIEMSDGLFNILGLDPKAGPPPVDFEAKLVHPDDRAILESTITTALQEKKSYSLDYRIFRANDEEERYLHVDTEIEELPSFGHLLVYGTTQDITERKKSEQKIRDALKMTSHAEQAANLGSWRWYPRTNRVEWSDNMCRLYGIKPSEFDPTFDYANRYTHPDDLDYVNNYVKLILTEKKSPPPSEYRIITPKDEIVWVEGRSWVMLDDKGDIEEVVGTIQNITERLKAQQTMQESEERYRGVVEDTPILICSFLPDGEITFANRAYCKYFGKTTEELIGLNFLTLIPKADRETVMGNITTLSVYAPTQTHEHSVIAPDNEIRWQRWTNRALFNETGEIIAYQSIGEDITNRKQAKEILQESEKRFQYAMEATKDGLYDWDLVTNEIYYSPSWKSMLGYEYNELPNDFSIWKKLTKPEDVKRSWKMQQELINQERKRFELEFKMKHKDGHWVDILSRATAIFDKKGKATRIVGTHVDITQRKLDEKRQQLTDTRLSVVFNNTSDLQILTSVEPDDIFRIVTVNNAYIEAGNNFGLEISKEKLVGKTLEEGFSIMGISQDVLEYTKQYYRAALSTKEAVKYTESIPFELGTYHAEITLVPILGQDEQESYILYNSHNVSELRETANELEKLNVELEDRVKERTKNLQIMVEAMTGREVRMAGLKKVIKKLRTQLQDAGLEPVADDPLLGDPNLIDDELI